MHRVRNFRPIHRLNCAINFLIVSVQTFKICEFSFALCPRSTKPRIGSGFNNWIRMIENLVGAWGRITIQKLNRFA
jgi:hypothetical protein